MFISFSTKLNAVRCVYTHLGGTPKSPIKSMEDISKTACMHPLFPLFYVFWESSPIQSVCRGLGSPRNPLVDSFYEIYFPLSSIFLMHSLNLCLENSMRTPMCEQSYISSIWPSIINTCFMHHKLPVFTSYFCCKRHPSSARYFHFMQYFISMLYTCVCGVPWEQFSSCFLGFHFLVFLQVWIRHNTMLSLL